MPSPKFDRLVKKTAKNIEQESSRILDTAARFYVYALLDPRKPGVYRYLIKDKEVIFDHEPFYIGKGTGGRMYHHIRKNKGQGRKQQRITSIVRSGNEVLVRQLSALSVESIALAKEILLIQAIGRQDTSLGPLANHSDGGEGPSGAIRSEETKLLLSIINIGRKQNLSEEGRLARQGNGKLAILNCHTPEARLKQAESLRGRTRPQEEKDAISSTLQGRKFTKQHRRHLSNSAQARATITCPNCGLMGKQNQMKRWHFDNCTTSPSEVENGKRKVLRQTTRRWADEVERKRILVRLQEGCKQKDIAEEFGRSREFIRTVARSFNL